MGRLCPKNQSCPIRQWYWGIIATTLSILIPIFGITVTIVRYSLGTSPGSGDAPVIEAIARKVVETVPVWVTVAAGFYFIAQVILLRRQNKRIAAEKWKAGEARRRELITSWREMVARVVKWSAENPSANRDAILAYARKQPEFITLRNYAMAIVPVDAPGTDSRLPKEDNAAIAWLTRNVNWIEWSWELREDQ
jgi:hypothetical protein